MDTVKQQRVKKQLVQTLAQIDILQAQLRQVRESALALAQAMRQVREESQKARQDEATRQRRAKVRLVG